MWFIDTVHRRRLSHLENILNGKHLMKGQHLLNQEVASSKLRAIVAQTENGAFFFTDIFSTQLIKDVITETTTT